MVSPKKTLSLPKLYVQDHDKRSSWASLVAQTVKKLPAVQEIQVRSLDREDPLEKEWQPIAIFLPGEFHGQAPQSMRSKELDMAE